MYYNWWRYYEVRNGAYLTPDPLGLSADDSLYSYVQNSPSSWADPWGLVKVDLKKLPDFKYYKNWGGPGWTAGKWTSWEKMSPTERQEWLDWLNLSPGQRPFKVGRPADDQDLCYMKHDICYGEARLSCKRNNNGCEKDCVRKKVNICDFKLSGCLAGLGLSCDLLDEAHRITVIPVFVLQPGVRNAVDHNKKYGTSDLLRYNW